MGCQASKPAATGSGCTGPIHRARANHESKWMNAESELAYSPYTGSSCSEFIKAAAHILCCCDTEPQVHKHGVSSGLATTRQEEHEVPPSLQEQITRTAPEDAPPGDGTKVSHVQAAVTVSGSPTPVPLPQEGPKTLPAILAPLAASTPSNKSRQAQITPVALAVRTDASMSKSSAVNAVHPEAVLVVDSMLDGVAEDLNKTIAAEVNLLVNDLIDGLVVDIDEAMRHEVEVIVEEMMCAVVVDFDALVQSEVDNVVSVMMNGLLVDLNKTVQAEVDVIVDEMLGDVVEGVHKAEADLLHLPTSILYNTHMCEEEEEVVDPMQPGAARIRTWDAMAALSEVHAAADEQFLLAGRITKLEPYGDNALEVQASASKESSEEWQLREDFFEKIYAASPPAGLPKDIAAAGVTPINFDAEDVQSCSGESEAFGGMEPVSVHQQSEAAQLDLAALQAFTRDLDCVSGQSLYKGSSSALHRRRPMMGSQPIALADVANVDEQGFEGLSDLADGAPLHLWGSQDPAQDWTDRSSGSYATLSLRTGPQHSSLQLGMPSGNQLPAVVDGVTAQALSAVSGIESVQVARSLSRSPNPVLQVFMSAIDYSSCAFATKQTAQHSSCVDALPQLASSLGDADRAGLANATTGSTPPSQQTTSAVIAGLQQAAAEAVSADASIAASPSKVAGASAPIQLQPFTYSPDGVRHLTIGASEQLHAASRVDAGFEEIDIWATPMGALSTDPLTRVPSPLSEGIAPQPEQLSHLKLMPLPRSAVSHAAPMLQHQVHSNAALPRQDAVQRAHATRHISSGGPFADVTSPSRQGSATENKFNIIPDADEPEGTLKAWKCVKGGITAVKLERKGSLQSHPLAQGNSLLRTPPVDDAAAANGSASSADLHSGTSSAGQSIKAVHSPAPVTGPSAKLWQVVEAASGKMAVQYEAASCKMAVQYEAASCKMAVQYEAVSGKMAVQYEAARQVVQDQRAGTERLQQRGASLMRTISDKARPALTDAASKTAAAGNSLAAKTWAALASVAELGEAERQLATPTPEPLTVSHALGDVFGLSQVRVDGVVAASARRLASWRSWGRWAE